MDSPPPVKRSVLIVNLLFPLEYGLFIAFNLLDLLFTLMIIRLGGIEANPIADFFLRVGGKPGFIAFKLVVIFFVVGLCEFIGRRNRLLARGLLWFAIVALLGLLVMQGMQLADTL